MKLTIILAFLLSMSTGAAFSQSFNSSKLDRYFDTLSLHHKFMGSLAISKNGQLIYTKSVGFADISTNRKADFNSKYRIGSISKTFTAVLVMKAISQKRLSLYETIERFFPSIKNAGKITIQELLCHRSGIHNFTDDSAYASYYSQPKTEKQLIEIISKGESDFEPGTKWQYSNSNYVLLSFMLEKIFHSSYSKLLKKYIIYPIGLKNTYYGGKINPRKDECNSYAFEGKWKLLPETDMSIPMGAGGVVSTPSDLVKFSDALFTGKLVSKEQLNEMETMHGESGMGLFKIPFYDKISFGHNGGIDGFESFFSYFPEDKLSIAIISNGINYNFNDIGIAVLSAVYDKPYLIPDFLNVSSAALNQYVGIYSSAQLPLKITITEKDGALMAQASGQSAFPLTPISKDKFGFAAARITIIFSPEEKTFILQQGGGEYKFKKE